MYNRLLILICFIVHQLASAQSDKLRYTFQLNEAKDAIDVIMTYQFNKGVVSFLVPSNYDNTTLTNSILVKNLELDSEGELVEGKDGNFYYKGTEKNIIIKYTIPSFSNNSEFLPCQGNSYFQPVITKNFFHMYGDKSLVIPTRTLEEKLKFDLSIEWIGFPKDWHIANDFGISKQKKGKRELQFRKNLTRDNLGESLLFGGVYKKAKFTTKGIEYHTYIYGDFKFSTEHLVSQIKKISKVQMQFWKHFNHSKDYVISITQKGNDCGKLGGRNMFDSFSFYLSGNFTKKHIPVIFSRALTHEFTHSWIGTNLIENNPQWEEMRWFLEGFTEYYSWLINHKAKIINDEEYLSILNSKISSYFRSPYAKTTLSEFVEKYQFSDKFLKLAYDKGAVFAFYLDGYFRKHSNNKYNLKDFMLALLETKKDLVNGNLNNELLIDIAKKQLGVDISKLIETYIIKGNIIPIESPLIESKKFIDKIAFDYGFDFLTSMDKEVIIGLKDNSNAYKQGLRNGQKLKAIKGITNKVTGNIILEVNGKGKTMLVSFKPQGELLQIPVINKLTAITN